jgi:D-3-phosphoglycerate dehydrogenase
MYKVKSTSLDFGKTSREPIDYLIKNGCEYESVKVDPNSETDGIRVVKDADVLIVGLQQISSKILQSADKLKVIGRCGAGLDNVDLKAAGAKGIPVVFTPGANAHTVADFAFGLMLALTRQIPLLDRATRKGEWKRVMAHDIWGKTLGIFGLGQIGMKVAQRARGFDMKILAYDVVENPSAAQACGARYSSKEEILKEADFISLHLPLTGETKGFISSGELKQMKKDAFLVNTSRGGIVDEKALYDALKQGQIAGAALDVFEKEPPAGNPLLELENFIGSPHLGGITSEAISRIGMTVARDVVAVLNGEKPEFLANGNYLRK